MITVRDAEGNKLVQITTNRGLSWVRDYKVLARNREANRLLAAAKIAKEEGLMQMAEWIEEAIPWSEVIDRDSGLDFESLAFWQSPPDTHTKIPLQSLIWPNYTPPTPGCEKPAHTPTDSDQTFLDLPRQHYGKTPGQAFVPIRRPLAWRDAMVGWPG